MSFLRKRLEKDWGSRELDCEGEVGGEKTEERILSMDIPSEKGFGMGRIRKLREIHWAK